MLAINGCLLHARGGCPMIIYFSGTGNSRFAAEFLGGRLGDKVVNAGQLIKAKQLTSFQSELPWIFVAPTYSWQMPHVFEEFIRRAQFAGNREAYFVLTCGGEIGNAGKYAARLCQDIGLHYCGIREVVMPENYIAMFRAPGEEEAKQIVEKAKPILENAAKLVRQGKSFEEKTCGFLDNLKSGKINEGFYRFFVKADPFYATDACVGCGKCVSECVLNNISLVDGHPVWGRECTQCMACICGCPMEAIEYGKRSWGKPRYQCPKV